LYKVIFAWISFQVYDIANIGWQTVLVQSAITRHQIRSNQFFFVKNWVRQINQVILSITSFVMSIIR